MIRRLSGLAAAATSLAFAACADVTVDSPASCVETKLTFALPGASAVEGVNPPAVPAGGGDATLTGTTPLDVGVLGWTRSQGALALTFVDGALTFPAGEGGALVRVALRVAPADAASRLPEVDVMSYAPSDAAKQGGIIDLAPVMVAATLMRYLEAGNVSLTYSVTLTDRGAAQLDATSRMCVHATARIQKSAS